MITSAHAGITWTQGETVDSSTTDIAVCNDGYIMAVRGPSTQPRLEYLVAPGWWRTIYSLHARGNVSCASSSWSPYQNRVVLEQPLDPATQTSGCVDVSPEIRQCWQALYSSPTLLTWDYWWYPDAPQNFRATYAPATFKQLSVPNQNGVLRFDPSTRVASVTTLTGRAGVSGRLASAKRVASTTQNGRTVVVALNDDNTFWINREPAPGALNLNAGSQWRQVGVDSLSRFLGVFIVDMELAVVNGQLKLYTLQHSGSAGFLYVGAIVD